MPGAQNIPKPSSELLLESVEIQNFRSFNNLQIPKLSRVNLVTGKNSVGKSTLLEALWLYSSDANPHVIDTLLRMRDELSFKINYMLPSFAPGAINRRVDEWLPYIFSLFHNRPSVFEIHEKIKIGPVIKNDRNKHQLNIGIIWRKEEVDGHGNVNSEIIKLSKSSPVQDVLNAKPYLLLKAPNRLQTEFSFENGTYGSMYWVTGDRGSLSYFVQSSGLHKRDVEFLWKRIALTTLENDVLEALHLVNPDLERISLLGEAGDPPVQIPFVKLKNLANPVPLSSLGDGLSHLFAIALVLVNAKNSLVMMDEVENGLHYSVLGDVWRFIFALACRHNVQVFATTHSWECVEAFQLAAAESEDEGALIRLQNKDGNIRATVFDEEDLQVITRDQIEVR